MNEQLLYIMAFVIPMVMLPLVLPMVVLMARRKRMTDNPSRRKLQERPVAVMGGTVVMLVLSVSLLLINVFYDLGSLFPVLCLMVILFIFGMLDDMIGLTWQFKLALQVVAVLLLYFGSNYGVHSLFSLFPGMEFHWSVALPLTLFLGVLLLNAVNFVDGIDGLATALTMLAAYVMGYWNVMHGFTAQALFSFAVGGVLLTFLVFNIFSVRYKTYLGDSGTLVLGLFLFIAVTPDTLDTMNPDILMDHYYFSHALALLSAMIFDLVRVVLWRMVNGQSPFRPDRTHLHHVYVDLGMSHLMAATTIVLSNVLVLLVWRLTAGWGLSQWQQLLLVFVFCALIYWGPFFHLTYLRDRRSQRYRRLSLAVRRVNRVFEIFHDRVGRLIDGHRSRIYHEIE